MSEALAYREEHGFLAHWRGVDGIYREGFEDTEEKIIIKFSKFEDFCPLLEQPRKVRHKDYWPNLNIEDCYNGDPILPIEVPVIGDRWHDLYKATDAAIRASGDYHHIFIEEYWLDPYGYIDVRLGS